jgi:predicted nucleotidyltransferase
MPTLVAPDNQSSGLSYAFYRSVMSRLNDAGIEFLVGGAYALAYYTTIQRNTKDFDIFVRRGDMERALAALESGHCHTEFTYPHWLGKAICGDDFVDIIFSSGNAVAHVDDEWFAHAPRVEILGMEAQLSPAEEMLWSKAFIMERERFDGADVLHVILRCGASLDWPRMLRRFDAHWRVLFSHLVMFGFVYPDERTSIPQWVLDQLLMRMQNEQAEPPRANGRICRGPLVSRAQYLIDTEHWGYTDARLAPQGPMSDEEVAQWTAAIHG